jgi:hypothetical protein
LRGGEGVEEGEDIGQGFADDGQVFEVRVFAEAVVGEFFSGEFFVEGAGGGDGQVVLGPGGEEEGEAAEELRIAQAWGTAEGGDGGEGLRVALGEGGGVGCPHRVADEEEAAAVDGVALGQRVDQSEDRGGAE